MTTELHQADVDLQGLLNVLAENLYSTPEVALRELVQNAHDSITRRELEAGADFEPAIRVMARPSAGEIEIVDTGAGLTHDEVQRFLATIGAGYTRLLRQSKGDRGLIGAFGLGFLSAYVVSDRVEVRTTSFQEPDRTWLFVSRDGRRYTLEETEPRPVGTSVTLVLSDAHQHLADPRRVRMLLAKYGCLLPIPVYAPDAVNAEAPPWRRHFDSPFRARKAELAFAERFEPVFGPLCTIPLEPVDGVGAHGLMWVQDGASYATSDNRHVSLFVRGMLISDDVRKLLPDWAGFIGAVIECDGLVPTASREEVLRDALFGRLAAHVQETLIAGLRNVSQTRPEAWRTVRLRHNEALRGAAMADERLFDLLEDVITVPTTEGELLLPEVLERSKGRLVLTSGEESGTEEVLFRALSRPVVLGTRFAAAPFLRRFADKRGIEVLTLGTAGGNRSLFPDVPVDDAVRVRLDTLLGSEDVAVCATRFEPKSLPIVRVPDRDVELKRRLEDDEADRRIAGGLLALARGFTAGIEDGAVARLYVNLDSPLIRAVLEAEQPMASHIASILVGLAELTGRSHVEGMSTDLGVVLEQVTNAVLGLIGAEES